METAQIVKHITAQQEAQGQIIKKIAQPWHSPDPKSLA
ncbi:unnamed protein product, partial [marine sediment metagenome]